MNGLEFYTKMQIRIYKHIEKFIDPKRIETIGYFDYFDIRHSDQGLRT
jgi:hypothetical protein